VFKKYYLKINYYDEDENLLKEEFIWNIFFIL
jgi:hypothetical protein